MDSKILKRAAPKAKTRTGKPAARGPDSDVDSSGIRTIHVATRILKALAEYRDPVRVTDLARQLNMTMPTVSRHLSTWRELGFVDKPDGQETYRLGTTLFMLGQAAAEQNTHVSVAYPFLRALRDQVRETTVFSTRFQDQATVLVCLDSGRPTTIVIRPGSTLKLPYSPSARILWAFSSAASENLDEEARKFEYSEQPGFNKDVFKKKIRLAQKNFLDFEVEVRTDGLGGISCPVFDHYDKIAAVVTLHLPSASLSDPPDRALVEPLKECAARISQALGSSAWLNKSN